MRREDSIPPDSWSNGTYLHVCAGEGLSGGHKCGDRGFSEQSNHDSTKTINHDYDTTQSTLIYNKPYRSILPGVRKCQDEFPALRAGSQRKYRGIALYEPHASDGRIPNP
jgi:hypothetical protein